MVGSILKYIFVDLLCIIWWLHSHLDCVGRIMVFNAMFNNISAISWWSDLLVEETGVTGENHRPARTGLKCIGVKPND